MTPHDTFPASSETEGWEAVERAVARAVAGTGFDHADIPLCERAARWNGSLVKVLEGAGWTVERRGEGLAPKPMAQIAALETDRRRLILYIPFLRWVAASWNNGRGRSSLGPLADLPLLDAFGPITETDRALWLEVMALTHEFFHALDCDASLRGEFLGPGSEGMGRWAVGGAREDSTPQGDRVEREAREREAHRFVSVAMGLLLGKRHT